MTEVILQYKPIAFLPFQRAIKRQIPEGWHELDNKLFIAVSEFMHLRLSETKLLSKLFSVKKHIIRKLNRYYKYKLFELFAFITDLKPYHSFVIKKIGKLNAPGDNLKGVTFGCFIFADTYYLNYCTDNKIEDLNKFIACLYRNKPFDENDVDYRANTLIVKISAFKKQTIFLNYTLIKEWLATQYPHVFVKAINDEDEKKKPAKKKKQISGWVGIFDALVGDNIEDSDKYAELPATQVFRYLNNSYKKQIKHGSKT